MDVPLWHYRLSLHFWGMGEDFRSWYGQLSQLRSLLPSVAALSATATPRVEDSIVRALQMAPLKSVVLSANQPNMPCSSNPSITSCLFAVYHARVAELDKKQILESILYPDCNCRMLVLYNCLWYGIDVSNIIV